MHDLFRFLFFQIGNAYIDYTDRWTGTYDHFWTSALISDETHDGIISNCNFSSSDAPTSDACDSLQDKAFDEKGEVFIYDIYAPLCGSNSSAPSVFFMLNNQYTYIVHFQRIQRSYVNFFFEAAI